MKVKQGDIFLANLSPTKGREQVGFRPVLVMQNDVLNRNLSTVIIAPMTSNMKAKGKLTTFFLSKGLTKLARDSVVLLFQMRTIDKSRLEKKVAHVDDQCFSQIKGQMRFVF